TRAVKLLETGGAGSFSRARVRADSRTKSLRATAVKLACVASWACSSAVRLRRQSVSRRSFWRSLFISLKFIIIKPRPFESCDSFAFLPHPRFEVRFEPLLQRFPPAVNQGFCRRKRAVQNLGDLLVTQLILPAKYEGSALVF